MPQSRLPVRNYVWLLVVLIVIVGIAYAFENWRTQPAPGPQHIPPPTAADTVQSQKPFQYVVSYSSGTFQPGSLSMKVGETVRFTNNSSASLEIAEQWMISPMLQQGQDWEFTASAPGTYTFQGGGTSMTITVTTQ